MYIIIKIADNKNIYNSSTPPKYACAGIVTAAKVIHIICTVIFTNINNNNTIQR